MSAAATAAVAAPLLLLPVAYLLWWADRYRVFPLPRYLAVLCLAGAAGLLLAARWPAPAAAGAGIAGPAMPGLAVLGDRAPALAAEAGRFVLAALAVLIFLLWRGRVETPVDGVPFGVAAGVGLVIPALWLGAESEPGTSALALLGRALAPLGAAVIAGVAVAGARVAARLAVRAVVLLCGAAAGIVIVAGARLAAGASRPWALEVLLAFAVAGAVGAAFAAEVRVGTRELAEEARLGVLPPWVVGVIPRYWRRVRSSWWPRRDERRALSRLLLRLAFRKHRLRHLDGARSMLYSLEVGRLRERARRLLDPGRLGAADSGGGE